MNKQTLGNTLLLILFTLITFGLLESVIGNFLITQTPIKFHFALPDGVAILTQSSKSERIPKNYIAIAGDSYAQGKGDWLLESDPATNGPYHSAHLLQQLTGKDVISFGKSGASNIKGWSREPGAKFSFISAAIDDDIQPPELVLAYFYAGNDLMENVVQLRKEFFPKFGEKGLNDDASWDQFFNEQIAHSKMGPYRGINTTLGWLPRAVVKIIKNELKEKKKGSELGDIKLMQAGSINMARVEGEPTALPNRLQSPGLELDQTESELGFLAAAQSLRDLKQRFNQSQIVVVYIPSVLESYEIISKQISVEDRIAATEGSQPKIAHSTARLKERSNEVATRIHSIAQKQAIPFIDTRPQIRAAASREIIHGPKDWLHFNKRGYEALANAIACGVVAERIWPASSCKEG